MHGEFRALLFRLPSTGVSQMQQRRQTTRSQRLNRSEMIGFRVEAAVKSAAEHAAAQDHRTLSSLLQKLLVDFLHAQGYLQRPVKAPGPI
jgi:hypothetical protein